jgi:hypothetical protein
MEAPPKVINRIENFMASVQVKPMLTAVNELLEGEQYIYMFSAN